MNRRPVGIAVSLTLLMSVMLATNATPTEQFHGHGIQGHAPAVSPPIVPHGFFGFPNFPTNTVPRPFPPHVFPPRPFPHHRFIPFGVPVGPAIVYAPSYVPSLGYGSSPGGYYATDDWGYYGAAVNSPVGSTSVATAPNPMPNVVQYPTGRYELRGDGLTVPYTWVWIPNPPSAPPAGPPGGTSFWTPASPARHDKLFRWTDGQGVLHVTDRWEVVPPEYRAQAKSPEPS